MSYTLLSSSSGLICGCSSGSVCFWSGGNVCRLVMEVLSSTLVVRQTPDGDSHRASMLMWKVRSGFLVPSILILYVVPDCFSTTENGPYYLANSLFDVVGRSTLTKSPGSRDRSLALVSYHTFIFSLETSSNFWARSLAASSFLYVLGEMVHSPSI